MCMAPPITCECGTCKTCKNRKYHRTTRANHPDKWTKRSRDAGRKRREKNPELVREESRVGQAIWRSIEENRKREQEKARQRYAANPLPSIAKSIHQSAKRRAVEAAGDLTAMDVLLLRMSAVKCPLCEVALTGESNQPNSKHLDHIIPLAIGGPHTKSNVRITCRTCNLTRPHDGSDLTE